MLCTTLEDYKLAQKFLKICSDWHGIPSQNLFACKVPLGIWSSSFILSYLDGDPDKDVCTL